MPSSAGNERSIAELQAQIRRLASKAKQLGARDITEQRLAAAILARGKLTEQLLAELLQEAAANRVPLARMLTERDVISREDLLVLHADTANLPFINLAAHRVHDSVLNMIPAEIIRSQKALPYKFDKASGEQDEETLWVALANPSNAAAKKSITELMRARGMRVQFAAAAPEEMELIIDKRVGRMVAAEASIVEDAVVDSEPEDLLAGTEDGPAPQLFNEIFAEAVQRGASDVHIEPGDPSGLVVRMRIDGVMQYMREIPESLRRPVMAVMKLRMNMNVTERRRPQPGRITIAMEGRRIDLRAECGPVVGEREQMVVRLLDKEGGIALDLTQMDFSPANYERYLKAVSRPQGSILVTGPTGSGKSSTLYATLRYLTDETKKIITIEDPVEYQIGGIQQMQVNPNIDPPFGFPDALRSALRMDPDIVMVGEIRDETTARIALRAANTGHLMLSTLHTNEAAAAPMQLLQMNVPENVVAQALSAVVAQRLARRLCTECRIPYQPSVEDLVRAGYDQGTATQIHQTVAQYRYHRPNPDGCGNCTRGYRGRIAIHEVLLIEDEERELLLSAERSMLTLRRLAQKNGMRSFRFDGLDKAAAGVTSLDEVLRVAS